MATQITFTSDVGKISVASNSDASIIWYVYERPYLTGTSIFVQRDINGTLESEVRLLAEGERPEIFFDPIEGTWIFCYVLNENLYLITLDENDAPATQVAQTATIIDNLQLAVFSAPVNDSVKQLEAGKVIGNMPIHADATKPISAIAVAASPTPSSTMMIRWRALPSSLSNLNLNIAGFNVYGKLHGTGKLVRFNSTLVPFVKLDPHIYEFEIPSQAAKYFVTQVNFKGPNSTQLIEGKIKAPFDTIESDGISEPAANTSRLSSRFNSSMFPSSRNITVVETRPVNVIPPTDDYIQTAFGKGMFSPATVVSEYGIVQVKSGSTQPIVDTYTQTSWGKGIGRFISGTAFGSIIIG